MKRIASVFFLTLLIAGSSGLFAQRGGDLASTIIREARDRIRQARIQSALAADERVPYTPILISFVPMVSIPFGFYDTNIAAGIIGTLARDVHGGMASSVFNIARDVRGFEAAGVFNIADTAYGAQLAGVFSTAGDMRGVQVAGVFNQAGEAKGVQAAGVFNLAGNLRGSQFAGVFNYATHATGLQVGVVNVADTMDGIQLGLVNIAKDGATGLGIAYDPTTSFVSGWWQNGTRTLYTVFTAEMPVQDLFADASQLVVGAGIGTRLGAGRGYPYLDAEIIGAQNIGSRLADWGRMFTDCDASAVDLLSAYPEIRLRLGIPVTRSISLVGGFIVDFDLADAPNLPAALKSRYAMPFSVFGYEATAYGRWFVGVKL